MIALHYQTEDMRRCWISYPLTRFPTTPGPDFQMALEGAEAVLQDQGWPEGAVIGVAYPDKDGGWNVWAKQLHRQFQPWEPVGVGWRMTELLQEWNKPAQ